MPKILHNQKETYESIQNHISVSYTHLVVNVAHTLNNIGLFGAVEGGSITNLTVDADGGVKGGDNVGILAGSVEGLSLIHIYN